MTATGFVLAVGLYGDVESALMDLRDLTNPGPTREVVAGAGVVSSGPRGPQLQQGEGGTTAYGIGTGAAAGIVAGLWLPQPVLTTLAGAVIGGLIGRRLQAREANHLAALLQDDLRSGTTALVTVVLEPAVAEVQFAMSRSTKTTARQIDDEATRRVARALVRGNPVATEALGGSA